jgi:transketolase
VPHTRSELIPILQNAATQLRIDSVRSTTQAGSGHPRPAARRPTSWPRCSSPRCGSIPGEPQHPHNDRFVLSKGHAAPLLYAAWAAVGLFPRDEVLKLRELTSDLEGHPTPRLPFVDVATGSLGQGLAAGVGIALNAGASVPGTAPTCCSATARRRKARCGKPPRSPPTTSSIRSARLTDVNRLGQSRPTMHQHDLEVYARKYQAFGWHTVTIDGHDLNAILDALAEARQTTGRPTMILARTLKGKGISFIEDKDAWHGKPLKKDEMERALKELEAQYTDAPPTRSRGSCSRSRANGGRPHEPAGRQRCRRRPTRSVTWWPRARPTARRSCASGPPTRASSCSTPTWATRRSARSSRRWLPDRFVQNYIAEQVMVGAAMGLAARGAIPFPSTFACFLTRAYDFIRMACISNLNVKLAGSHAGVSIGEDGPSQMALEDLAMMRAQPNMTVLYPCDAVSAERLVELAAYHLGPAYIRTSRPKTPVIYEPGEPFRVGGSKVLRQSASDTRDRGGRGSDGVRGAEGVRRAAGRGRVHPRHRRLLGAADRCRDAARGGRETGGPVITVEDHYAAAGSATRWRRRSRPAASRCGASPCARSRAAASPTSCSSTSASRQSAIVAAVKG